MAARPFFSLIALVFHAGALLLLFFIVLAGTQDSFPLNDFYFFQADTSSIRGAPSTSRWSLYGVCSVSDDGKNVDCTKNKAAYPFDPTRNFGTEDGVPLSIVSNHQQYYLMTRFAFAFYLIALFFDFIAFFFSFLGLASRLGSGLSSLSSLVAWVFVSAASALITATYVKAKNGFHDDGKDAKLGVKLFAFTWTVVFLLLATFILSCCACGGRKKGGFASDDAYYSSSAVGGGFGSTSLRRNRSEKEIGEATPTQKRGFFHVKRKDDNYDSESQNPVIASNTNNNNNDASSFERQSPL